MCNYCPKLKKLNLQLLWMEEKVLLFVVSLSHSTNEQLETIPQGKRQVCVQSFTFKRKTVKESQRVPKKQKLQYRTFKYECCII